jgi:hypothetical protein
MNRYEQDPHLCQVSVWQLVPAAQVMLSQKLVKGRQTHVLMLLVVLLLLLLLMHASLIGTERPQVVLQTLLLLLVGTILAMTLQVGIQRVAVLLWRLLQDACCGPAVCLLVLLKLVEKS